jgi:hypothetical protein
MGLGRVQRRPEIDALRGVFLVWMTLAHLPTHLSDLVNEPFGFVSSAEGFVFLSALLVARLYIRQAAGPGPPCGQSSGNGRCAFTAIT